MSFEKNTMVKTQQRWNTPSTPITPMASTMSLQTMSHIIYNEKYISIYTNYRVRRKGTVSGMGKNLP